MSYKHLSASLLAAVINTGMNSQAVAAGFIEDSTGNLAMRNMYYNSDYRSHNSNPRQEEWGQSFTLNLQSGFTQGTVGFGLDARGVLGVRLDGGGRSGKNDATRNPSSIANAGNMFPVDSDNTAVNQFSYVGLTGKMRISKTEARVGNLMPRNPVIFYNDGRIIPQSFSGGQITSKEIEGLTLTAAQIERGMGRASSDGQPLSVSGARNGADTNQFYFAGADYSFNKDLLGQYYYGNLDNFYSQHFAGLNYTLPLPVGSLKTDLRYWYSQSDGNNASAAGRNAGYTATGFYGRNAAGTGITRGEVDNQTWSAALIYSLDAHVVTAGYQQVTGDSNFPYINQGDVYPGAGGATTYLITDRQLTNFARAGERTVFMQYNYDFTALGIPGLTTSMVYLSGSHIQTAGGELSEWERDIAISYVIQSGQLKGLGFALKNAEMNSQATSDVDQNRLILSYTLPLF
jgi:hypothetical protein